MSIAKPVTEKGGFLISLKILHVYKANLTIKKNCIYDTLLLAYLMYNRNLIGQNPNRNYTEAEVTRVKSYTLGAIFNRLKEDIGPFCTNITMVRFTLDSKEVDSNLVCTRVKIDRRVLYASEKADLCLYQSLTWERLLF